DQLQLEASAGERVVVVGQLHRQARPPLLVDAPRALAAGDRVESADGDGVGAVADHAARRGSEGAHQQDGSQAAHHHTARTVAATWVAAGTDQPPLAQRCQPRTRPAARSRGRTAQPHTVTCTAAKLTADAATARPGPRTAANP